MNNWAKGLKAEKIVSAMFKEAGYKVVKYGYEYTIPELTPKNHGTTIKGEVGQYIRHQPDFIIVNDKDEAYFVEVKFRSSYIKPDRDIFPYPKCIVLLLDKNYIYAQTTHYLFNKGADFVSLRKFPFFSKVSNEIIDKYEKKLQRQLGDDTWIKQKGADAIRKLTGRDLVPHEQPQVVKTQRGDTIRTPKGNVYTRAKSVPAWVISKLGVMRKNKRYRGRKEFFIRGKEYYYIVRLDGRAKKWYIRKRNK